MTTTTTTTAAKAPKQFTFGISESLKGEMNEFRKDFTRPAAVKNAPEVVMSEREAFEVLHTVATDRRFKTVPVMETVDGMEVQALDEDGLPAFKTLDLIQDAWEAIKLRDHSESVSKTPTIAGLIASIRNYGKKLAMSETAIQAMVDAAMTAPAGE
jgi:hypothetical protein